MPTDPIGTTNGDYVIGDLSIKLSQKRADDSDSSSLGVITEMPIYNIISDISEITDITEQEPAQEPAQEPEPEPPANDAPVLTGSLTNQFITDADNLNYQFPSNTFYDADVLTYSASGLPDGITFNSDTRTFSGTPSSTGSSNVTVTATDTSGLSVSASFNIEVENAPVVATLDNTLVGYVLVNGLDSFQEMLASDYITDGGTLVIPENFWIWSDNTAVGCLND